MMHRTPPFVLPSPISAIFHPWTYRGAALPEMAEDWDPSTDMEIRRRVVINLEELLNNALLPSGTPLALTVAWQSMPSYLSGTASRMAPVESGELNVIATLPGDRIGGKMTIRTTISLAEDLPGMRPGVAHCAGSVLIEDEAHIILEGTASRFPVTVENFAECSWDSDASWHLTFVDDDLRMPFLASCWLSINSRDSELVDAIKAVQPNDRQKTLLEQTFHNVTVLMIEAAEIAERVYHLSEQDWPEETLGSVLASYTDPNRLIEYDDVGGLPTPSMLAMDASRRDGMARRMGLGRAFI